MLMIKIKKITKNKKWIIFTCSLVEFIEKEKDELKTNLNDIKNHYDVINNKYKFRI